MASLLRIALLARRSRTTPDLQTSVEITTCFQAVQRGCHASRLHHCPHPLQFVGCTLHESTVEFLDAAYAAVLKKKPLARREAAAPAVAQKQFLYLVDRDAHVRDMLQKHKQQLQA